MGKHQEDARGVQSAVRSKAACHSGAITQWREMRLRLTGTDGFDPIGTVISHENFV